MPSAASRRCAAAMLLVIATCLAAAASNEMFRGGSFDGYAAARVYRFASVSSPRFVGGGFDGYDRGDACQPGGGGEQQLSGPRFVGGSFDGYGREFFPQSGGGGEGQLRGPRFAGGSFDGYDLGGIGQYDAGTSPIRISPRFTGGPHDGHDLGPFWQFTYLGAAQYFSARFLGGPCDGVDYDVIVGVQNPLDRDSDLDGLPDWWELPFFLGVTNANPPEDTDHDGFTEGDEFVALTDPTNAASYFHIGDFGSSNSWTLTFACTNERMYSLQSVTNVGVGPWAFVDGQTNVVGEDDGFLSLTAPYDTNRHTYRVTVGLPE